MTFNRTVIDRVECSCGCAVDLSSRLPDAPIDVIEMLKQAHSGDGHVLTVTCSAATVSP